MEQNSNLHFFKRGIQPLWEDPANKDGGKWVLTIKADTERLSKAWQEVVGYWSLSWGSLEDNPLKIYYGSVSDVSKINI